MRAQRHLPVEEIPMKAIWNGVVLAECADTVLVDGEHYFPESTLRREYTSFSNHRAMCSEKGQAHYLSLLVNGEFMPDAVWYYPQPRPGAEALAGRVAFSRAVQIVD
jgi:uncharacterized protein (DUF427 family)